ncbi:MAG: GH3 family domain-containing protein, partial [Bdellovibrionota bacterium]
MLNLTPLLKAYSTYRSAQLSRQNPIRSQRKTLNHLIQKASQTEFGKQHGFQNIHSVEDYQQAVPLRAYEDFWKEFWEPRFPYLTDCTWPGTIDCFPVSSGTSSGTTK